MVKFGCTSVNHLFIYSRRRSNDKDARRFRQLPSNTDTGNSKHSGPNGYDPRMDIHAVDQRLPKVSSSGLWMGAPSMYSKEPSDAYYIDRPKRTPSLQRASSETRLSGTRMSLHASIIYRSIVGMTSVTLKEKCSK